MDDSPDQTVDRIIKERFLERRGLLPPNVRVYDLGFVRYIKLETSRGQKTPQASRACFFVFSNRGGFRVSTQGFHINVSGLHDTMLKKGLIQVGMGKQVCDRVCILT